MQIWWAHEVSIRGMEACDMVFVLTLCLMKLHCLPEKSYILGWSANLCGCAAFLHGRSAASVV